MYSSWRSDLVGTFGVPFLGSYDRYPTLKVDSHQIGFLGQERITERPVKDRILGVKRWSDTFHQLGCHLLGCAYAFLGEQLVVEDAQSVQLDLVTKRHVGLAEISETFDDPDHVGRCQGRLLCDLGSHLLGSDCTIIISLSTVNSFSRLTGFIR